VKKEESTSDPASVVEKPSAPGESFTGIVLSCFLTFDLTFLRLSFFTFLRLGRVGEGSFDEDKEVLVEKVGFQEVGLSYVDGRYCIS